MFANSEDILGDVDTEAEVFEASLQDCMAFNQTYEGYFVGDFDPTLFPADIASRLSSFCFNGIPVAELTIYDPSPDDLNILIPCSNTTSEDQTHLVFVAIPFWAPKSVETWSFVVCQPTYSLSRRRISAVASFSSVFQLQSVSENASEALQLGISPTELTIMFNKKLDIFDVAMDMVNPKAGDSLLLSCLNITSPKPWWSYIGNPDTLQNAFEQFFRSAVALHVKSHYSVPSNLTTTGSLTSATTRLFVGKWSLRLMEGFLGLLFILSLLLSFYKCPLFSQDPAPLAVQTMFLAKNPYLESVLQHIGKFSNEGPEWVLLKKSLYYSAEDGLENIQSLLDATLSASSYMSLHINMKSSNSTTKRFYRPDGWRQITASWGYRVAVLACTVLLVTSLEVLFRISTKNKGHSDMPSLSPKIYVWNYLPSLVMASISVAYSSLDYTARILHPFQRLNTGEMIFKELFWEPLGASTIQAIVQSARWHHFALTMILLTSFLAPTLTIITSGLFTTSTILYQGQAPFSALDWVPNKKSYGNDISGSTGRGQFVSNAIEFGNLSFPQWTHEDLLFPQIRLDLDQAESVQGLAHSMSARLPSIRPRMNCTFRGFWDQASYHSNTFNVTTPPECVHQGPTMSFGSYEVPVRLHAAYLAATLITSDDIDPSDSGETVCYDTPDDTWFAVARMGHNVLEDVSLIQCIPYIEALHTVVNFTLPNYNIDLSEGHPQPDETDCERRVLTNTKFSTRGMPILWQENPSNISIDSFFTSVIYGKDGPPIEELLGRANADRLISRMEQVYGRIGAQMLNDFRIPMDPNISAALPGLLDPSTFNATVYTHQQRLVQSALATRMLEGVLAMMALCAAIHSALTPKTRLLPYDPGSIAAKMKLFAGSRLIRMIRERNGELDDALLGENLSLGWWDEDEDEAARSETGERKRRFGIDVGVAAKEE